MESPQNAKQVYEQVRLSALPLYGETPESEAFYSIVARTALEPLPDMTWHVKDESVQPSGAYKLRGATWAISQRQEVLKEAGSKLAEVHALTTGNHGISTLYAAGRLGVGAVVHAPTSLTSHKRMLIEGAGELRVYPTFLDAKAGADEAAGPEDAFSVPPFDHYDVMAGQTSLGHELVDDLVEKGWTDNVTIPVPLAGGGLISGFAIPIYQAKQAGKLGPNVKVYGVQPHGADAMRRTIELIRNGQEMGQLFAPGEFDAACDALAIQQVGKLPTEIVADKSFVSGIALANRAEIGEAMLELYDMRGVWYEPAAALPYAFARKYLQPESRVVLPLSGGNVSSSTRDIYRRAAADGRWAKFQEHFGSAAEAGVSRITSGSQRTTGHAALSGYVAR